MVSMDTDSGDASPEVTDDPWANVRKNEAAVKRASQYGFSEASVRKIENQKALIDLISRGVALQEALRKLAIARGTYRSWRTLDKQFVVECDNAKMQGIAVVKGTAVTTEDLSDFAAFRKQYFGYETWPYMQEIARVLDARHKLRTVSLILVPPNHGKTTLLVDWICYKLALDPNHRFLVVSASQKHARKMVGQVKRRMTDPMMSPGVRQYIAKYGPFYEEGQANEGKPWAADYISVCKANNDEKDYSLEAIGWKGQIYGARCDTVIGDDIQTKDSLSQTETITSKLQQEVISRPHIRGGRIVVVGTRVGPGDVPEKMVDEGIVTDGQLIEFQARKPDGSPLEPNMYDDEDLTLIEKQSGPEAWATAYLMRPSAGTNATFTEPMVTQSLSDLWTCNARPKVPVIMSLDPALGGGNVLMCAAWTQTLLAYYDCQVDYKFARNEQIYARVDEMAGRHKPQLLIVETAALQKGLARDDRLNALAIKHGFRIIEHQTSGHKSDPILGVAMMPTSFIRGEIAIADGDALTKARMAEFRNQLLAWRPTIPTRQLKQDAVMAAWFIWLWWMNNRGRSHDDADAFDAQALPWNPTDVGEKQLMAAGGGW